MSNIGDLGKPLGAGITGNKNPDVTEFSEAGEHGRGVGISGGHSAANPSNTQSGGSSAFNAGLGGDHASAGIPKSGEHPIADKFMGSDPISGAYQGGSTGDALTGQSQASITGAGVGPLAENTRSSGLGAGAGAAGAGLAGAAVGGAYAGGSANDGLTGQSTASTTGAGVGPLSENTQDPSRAAALGSTAGGAAAAAGTGVGPAGGAGGHYSADPSSTGTGSKTAAQPASDSPLVKDGQAVGHYGTADDDSSRGKPISDPKQLDTGGPHSLVFDQATGKYVHRHELQDPDGNINLERALHGTGPPGIFDSSDTPDQDYGVYNSVCHMPHVRAKEYQRPGPEYELQYIEVIQRHNKRTPYASSTFFQEDIQVRALYDHADQEWDCTGHGSYAHAKSSGDADSSAVYWQVQSENENPFASTVGPGFVGSNCLFPGITSEGMSDSYQHGLDFRGVYRDQLGFLPEPEARDEYQWRVTHNAITSQTMGAFVKGLFSEVDEYSAMLQPASYDSLEPRFRCPLAGRVQAENEGPDTIWAAHLARSSDLRRRFNRVSGIEDNDSAGWATSWDHPFDNLQAKQCHQKPLPCSVNDTSICLSQQDADAIYRLGNWEYAYRYRGTPKSTLFSALKMTPWFRELQGHLRSSVAGESQLKYLHNFAHDGSMAALLGVLQIKHPIWPGLATEVVFELWKKESEYFIRVLFSGQPLVTSTPLGTLDMIPVDDFHQYLESVLIHDIVATCNA